MSIIGLKLISAILQKQSSQHSSTGEKNIQPFIIYNVDDSQSNSIFTLIGYFDEDRIMSKMEIDKLEIEVFSRYEYIDTVKVIGDAQKFGLANWTTDGKEFPRDKLLEFLRSYEEQE